MSRKRFLGALMLAAAAAAMFWWLRSPSGEGVTPAPVAPGVTPGPTATDLRRVEAPPATRSSASPSRAEPAEKTGLGTVSALGPGDLERLARAEPGFSTEDAAAVLRRARAVLQESAARLGLGDLESLGEPVVHPGPRSAQVFFPQADHGVPVFGYGTVTVDMGVDGEVLSVQSDYVHGLRVSPARPVLTAQEARLRALSVLAQPGTGDQIDGGAPVIWVPSPAQGAQARRAYEFSREGEKVLIDAGTGELIRRIPRRNF